MTEDKDGANGLRILLVDDHTLFRKGIASLLAARQGFTVVGEAQNGLEAVTIARQTNPDVILMDVNMPEQGGLETVKILKPEMPRVQIVMLTVSEDDDDLFEAVKNGASGYLLKNLEPQQLYHLLDGLKYGEAPISGTMAAKILHEFKQSDQETAAPSKQPDDLTEREVEVLMEVVTGATNQEIAETLHITENTVKIHLRNILEKLHVQNRVQAAVRAVR
ncbi:MAG: response regulator transcription factor, partial [Anaerolineae bacterium]|nr:response regulator transcription factor [Anaerolineae bacterium]